MNFIKRKLNFCIKSNRLRYHVMLIVIIFIGVFSTIYFIRNSETLQNINIPESYSKIANQVLNSFYNNETLRKKFRVLCWVMTQPKNHANASMSVKRTWGKRCDILLFMSSTNDLTLPTVMLPVDEGRDKLWAKSKEAFKYVYNKYLDKADWFMKADDDTYVIVENLRSLLSSYDPSEPLYLGCRFNPNDRNIYMSGGAGYVLSREALRRFVEEAVPNKTRCSDSNEDVPEDMEMGKCLASVNIKVVDTHDSNGTLRFSPFDPTNSMHFPNDYPDNWIWKYLSDTVKNGSNCCSDTAISFHYINPQWMYALDYLIYKLYII